MTKILAFLMLLLFLTGCSTPTNKQKAVDEKGRKVYHCNYMKNPPIGALAWSKSDMVQKGINKESRFVPYNSEAAKKLWLDATTVRTYNADPKLKGRETSFYQVYDERGWHVYIEGLEPNIEELVDSKKGGGSIDLFFVPGMENVYYHQMIIKPLNGKTSFYDWGMPHKSYRSMEGLVKVESTATEKGWGTYMFVPWELVYDRLPLNGESWRFSFMRWGTRVTWGGNVHDTGNFGLIKFQESPAQVSFAIQQNMLKSSWYKYKEFVEEANKKWNDEKVGDLDFYNQSLKPVIDKYNHIAEEIGSPTNWTESQINNSLKYLKEWMEFDYKVQELRAEYLRDKHFE
ncbi:MAG: hypothetical protein NE328_02515 [Lentisphaeraceae bacterium]|nr:hypothetical protein [Lentisphaeraceae bacterium]